MARNTNCIGKRAGHGPELIQRTRKAVLNTFDAIEKKGKAISEILADEFEKNPIKFMELAAKLMPKEIQAEVNHIMSAKDLSDDELADIATGRSAGAATPKESANEPDQLH